ncbi:MAG TPA: hypothetical protein VGL96_07100, partial [Casimicrobiaceae bacterium]
MEEPGRREPALVAVACTDDAMFVAEMRARVARRVEGRDRGLHVVGMDALDPSTHAREPRRRRRTEDVEHRRAEHGVARAQVDVAGSEAGAFGREPQPLLARGQSRFGLAQPQQRAHDGDELFGGQRLDEVDLGAAFHSDLLVRLADMRGRNMKDGDAARRRVALDTPAHFQSADVRKLDVEEHELRHRLGDEPQRGGAVVRLQHLKTGTAQNARFRVQRRLVVVDVEDRRRRCELHAASERESRPCATAVRTLAASA